MKKVIVYGAFWCSDTHRTAKRLRKLGVEYAAKTIENSPVRAKLEEILDPVELEIPVILFPDGTRLVNPDAKTLKDKVKLLREQGLLR